MVAIRTVVLSLFVLICASDGAKVPDSWTHNVVLEGQGKYHVYWTPVNDSITFKVEVATKGYVGFGFSPRGAMQGSDIVTGWVADGKVYFQDRHAKGNYMPIIDESQDWELLEGKENDTHTTLIFHRKLQTCDKDDIEIDDSTMRVIYAYNDKDPKSPTELEYHGSQNRGVRSVMLLQQQLVKDLSVKEQSTWDVLTSNYTLSKNNHTMYWCTILKGPELNEKNHIFKIEPLIQKGNEGYLHHMLMYECVGAVPERFDPHVGSSGHECYVPNMPDVMGECIGLYAAWGVGGEAMIFPEHVGMPLDPKPPKYYMLEVHYDNPALHDGISDRSGLRMYYTKYLRPNDAGTLMIGAIVDSRVVIPPGQEEFVIAGHGDPECTAKGMNDTSLNILGVFLHAHLIGRRIKARHFRGGVELPPFGDDKNYDFNYQEYHYFSNEVSFLPGDHISVECTYNSVERTNATLGGVTSRQEMCLAFFLYYPRMDVYASLSAPTIYLIMGLTGITGQEKMIITAPPDIAGKRIDDYLMEYNWENTNITAVENAMRYSPHASSCMKGTRHSMGLISYPKILKPYEKPSLCPAPDNKVDKDKDKKKGGGGGGNSNHQLSSTFLILAAPFWSLIFFRIFQ